MSPQSGGTDDFCWLKNFWSFVDVKFARGGGRVVLSQGYLTLMHIIFECFMGKYKTGSRTIFILSLWRQQVDRKVGGVCRVGSLVSAVYCMIASRWVRFYNATIWRMLFCSFNQPICNYISSQLQACGFQYNCLGDWKNQANQCPL